MDYETDLLDELALESAERAVALKHPQLGYGWRADQESDLMDEASKVVIHPTLGFGRSVAGRESLFEADDLYADQELILPDERRLVRNTLTVPFRWICCLDLFFPDPDVPGNELFFRGTGTLISDWHVLTAGHNLYNEIRGSNKVNRRLLNASRVIVAPARNGIARTREPLGRYSSTTFRTSSRWRSSRSRAELNRNREHDYALITLPRAIGQQRFRALGNRPLGYWGSRTNGGGTRITPLAPSRLRNVSVNISGYPGDKCRDQPAVDSASTAQIQACSVADWASTQWRAFNRVSETTVPGLPGLMSYQLDTFGGHSGSPVWLRWKGFRNLMAIHVTKDNPATPIVANQGVRITQALLNDVRSWMGARPSTSRPMLRRGSRGSAVHDLQRRLNRWIARSGARLSPLAVDGIFGSRTDRAVRALQRAQRIAVDGVVGPITWGRLSAF